MNFSTARLAIVVKDIATFTLGLGVGNMAVGAIDEYAKPKDGAEPGAVSKYAGPLVVAVAGTAGAFMLEGEDQRFFRIMSAGAATAGAAKVLARIMPAAAGEEKGFKKLARGAFGAAENETAYVPSFQLNTSLTEDADDLPEPGAAAFLPAAQPSVETVDFGAVPEFAY